VIQVLRAGRSVLFHLASPFEQGDRSETPPLWLRRQSGPVSKIESAAAATVRLVRELDLVHPGDAVLDAGCGFGIMARPLAEMFGRDGRYVGLDLHGASIRWAQKNVAATDRRFRFVLGSTSERFPAREGDIAFLLAKSLFTHLEEGDARRALAEITRVLAPGGTAMLTAFLFEPETPPTRVFPFSNRTSSLRWRWKSRPKAAIAYERMHLSRMITEAGLRIDSFRPGFWPGADRLEAQDILLLSRI
jgi:ubiquinone/menaquinone biosynthesis C-methylase UbiE